jgi:hypothetical protein
MTDAVYDESMDLSEVLEIHKNGGHVLCPVCHNPLTIVTPGSRIPRHHGIYCDTDSRHFRSMLEFRSQEDDNFWKQFINRDQDCGD